MNKNIDNYVRLSREFTKHITDTVWGQIAYHPSFEPILSSAPFRRLRKIRQLGPTYLVYPSATHNRYAHSLGVMHIASVLLKSLLLKDQTPPLTYKECIAFILAALLHDIGHFPYTHSLKDLPLPSHESLSARVILNELCSHILTTGADPALCAAIIDTKSENPKPASYAYSLPLFRRLLSGPVDADKLDYLNRDALHTGILTTPVSLEEFVGAIKVSKDSCVSVASHVIVEKVQFVKYLLYSQVYWHPEVRSITAMIKHALYKGLLSNHISAHQLIALDDESLLHITHSDNASSALQRTSYISDLQDFLKQASEGNSYQLLGEWYYEASFGPLCDLSLRSEVEYHLLQSLSLLTPATDSSRDIKHLISPLIIDIPEPVHFESTHIQQQKNDKHDTKYRTNPNNKGNHNTQSTIQSSSIFSDTQVDYFTRHLTRLRVFVAPQSITSLVHRVDVSTIPSLIQKAIRDVCEH